MVRDCIIYSGYDGYLLLILIPDLQENMNVEMGYYDAV